MPVSNTDGPALAEEVEQSAPLTASVGPEVIASWADASEVDSPPLLGADSSTGIHVKEEAQEAESIGAVLSTIGLPEEVADEPVATEVSETLEPIPTPAELGPDEVAAEVAFSDLDHIKEEGRDQAEAPSSPSEQVEAETTDILGLGDDESAVVGSTRFSIRAIANGR